MKHLLKPLEWKEFCDVHYASAYKDFLGYKIHSFGQTYAAKINLSHQYLGLKFKSLEEAKTACQEHYADMILSGLSPEVVAALESISSPNQTFNT